MYRSTGDTPDPSLDLIVPPKSGPAAPPPTADQIIQYVIAGDCFKTLAQEGGSACVDRNWMSLLLAYKFGGGVPPTGVSAATWKKFIAKADTCKWNDFPFCPSLDAQFGANVPECLTVNQVKMVEYCDKYPLQDGPDKNSNVMCWIATRSGTLDYNMHTVAPCAPGTPGGAQAGMGMGMKLGIAAALAAGVYMLTRRH